MRWTRTPGFMPGSEVWRVAVGFMIGAILFATGSLPAYVARVSPRVVGMTFVVGAVFFTLAASGQLLLEVRAHRRAVAGSAVAPRRGLTWWAAVVQLVGTLLFNVSTGDALATNLDAQQANRLVWAPDVFGSVAFLVASWLAWMAVCGPRWCRRPDDPDWWMAALNLAGSILFGLSAVGAVTLPTTGEPLSIGLVNATTALGALCFLVGAWLLLPDPASPDPASPDPAWTGPSSTGST